jgi:outer membrane cobalamin receptor
LTLLAGLRRSSVAIASVVVCAACGHAAQRKSTNPKPIGIYIDQAHIERSGGATAWDVLKREAPVMTFRENRNGQPARFGRRGRASILLDDSPLVYVDGVRMSDFRVLADLPAATLLDIWVLNGIDGTTYYGTDAVAGVVVIRTKQGTD